MNKFKISKSYEGFPSKNVSNYEEFETIEQAKQALDYLETKWLKNAGSVISKIDLVLIVSESDGSGIITFEIEEIN